jgi:hypothetical protein
MCYFHPVVAAKPELAAPCTTLPPCNRDHVYVFLIHGLDPFNFANLSGVRDYIQGLGFHKTYYGQLYHAAYFKKELHRIHDADPDAHFVLIGFSFGANMVRDLALEAKKDGFQIDLLVYLGGNTLDNTPHDRPDNVAMVVNVLATGCIWNGTTFDDAENINLPDVWHFGSPTHRVTLEVLARDLALVASRVGATTGPAEPSMPAASDTEPTPRPVMPQPAAKRDEWDFLKPTPTLSYSAPAAQPPDQAVTASTTEGRQSGPDEQATRLAGAK